MKKRIIALLLLAVMVMGLVACNTNKPTETTGNAGEVENNTPVTNFQVPEGGYDGKPVTITFYHTMGSNLTSVLDLYIAEFNKLYPNITIQYESVGGYDDVRDQISTQITVGNQPNIAYCYPDHVALYNLAQAVVQLDNLIESDLTVTRADGTTEVLGLTDEQKADFVEGYYNEGKMFGDGLMYTLPMSKSTEVLYYNKTFFDANNLTVPTTWAELEAVCAQISKRSSSSVPAPSSSVRRQSLTMPVHRLVWL